ncbi:class I SAM-dependent methyltransferase [Aestuariivirga sp.]|uniref:class I SAM-dependent methyltransferase n=1 Tax=Aestuariivirga sp. TaxID=2650926 RepID=UPI00391B3DC3
MIDNYSMDQFGVIHQNKYTPIVYDETYISYYQAKSDRTIKLGYQRLGWILGLLDRIPESVLEIGYGTGTFIEAAQIAGVRFCAGCDITAFPLPAAVRFLDWTEALEPAWDVVAMFDVLEHVPDLSFLARLKTNYLALAVSYCRWRELGDDWFRNWRMRLPDEHLHHFDPDSLVNLLAFYGFKKVTLNTFGDGIRLREGETGPIS